jgi:hypothetical protein
MIFCLLKIVETNFYWHPTVLLIYGNWFHYFRSCDLFVVIKLVMSISCSNCFIVLKIMIILG